MVEHREKSFQIIKSMESFVSSPVVKSFLAGSFSGTCSTILFQPLDRVKTLLQCGNKCNGTGVLTVAAHVIKTEKWKGLWTGVTPSLTRTVPGIGVYFCSLHTIRTKFGSADPRPLESITIGAAARSVSGLSLLPITVIKTRFESGQFKEYRGMSAALVTIYRGEGMRGLFSGLSATMIRDAPFSGLYFWFYTETKKFVKTRGIAEQPSPLVHFSCGILAGCLAAIATQPADVVKTNMQMNMPGCKSVSQTVVYIFKKDAGLRGFFTGIVPRTIRRTLMAAMAWTVYEQVMASVGMK